MAQIQSAIAQLTLFGAAGLYVDGKRVPLRNKSLAILYYLAIEGPISRAAMAELLWEHASARQNLRVELHELRHTLRKLGIVAFEGRRDPLVLPPGIVLDTTPRTGQILEGLERVSDSFREWLAGLRGRTTQVDEQPAEQIHAQASELAREIDPPFLLIVKGSPLAGFKTFALQLAREMGLPFIEGVEGGATAVRYLPLPQTEAQVKKVLKDDKSVWILPTAPFGEDHSTLLELRAQWPADRARFVTLKPLSWPAVVEGPLQDLPFERAAEIYLRSGGDAAHLKHLLELYRSGQEELPLPQQVRAAYQRESRFLSYPARLALERLSVHPGTLSDGLIEALEAHEHLDELERRGWLAYDDDWYFASEPARRVLYQALQPGRRAEYHRAAARYFAAKGDLIARYHHELAADPERRSIEPPENLSPWARAVWGLEKGDDAGGAPQFAGLEPLEEVFSEPPEMRGDGWGVYDKRFYFVRNGPPYRDNELVFPGADEPVLIRLRGRGYVENVLGIGLDGERRPLVLQVGRRPLVIFAPVNREVRLSGATLLPVRRFEVWVVVPQGQKLRFTSDAERAVVEFSLDVYRVRGAAEGAGLARVSA